MKLRASTTSPHPLTYVWGFLNMLVTYFIVTLRCRSLPLLYAVTLSDPGQTGGLKEDGHPGPAPFFDIVVAYTNRIFDVAVTPGVG